MNDRPLTVTLVRRTARDAAVAAGHFILSHFRRLRQQDIHYKGANDLVTFVDRKAETLIAAKLKAVFPDHGLLAEESGSHGRKKGLLWVVDPLDGTTNFVHGLPHFSVSLALLHDQRPIFGLIHDPLRRETFSAWLGQGALLNGRTVSVSGRAGLKGALGSTGFPFRSPALRERYMLAFRDFIDRSKDSRRCGSAALDLAYVACGRYDYFWEAFLQPWDFLAGALIVEEAGGRAGNFQGQPLGLRPDTVIAANATLYPRVLGIIQKHFRP